MLDYILKPMQFKTLREKDNTHMKRKELTISWPHIAGATPSRASIQELLVNHLKAEAEKIDVRNIFTLKGRPESRIKIFIWEEPKVENLVKAAEPKEEKAGEEPAKEEK